MTEREIIDHAVKIKDDYFIERMAEKNNRITELQLRIDANFHRSIEDARTIGTMRGIIQSALMFSDDTQAMIRILERAENCIR